LYGDERFTGSQEITSEHERRVFTYENTGQITREQMGNSLRSDAIEAFYQLS